jgi:hypothetical protein
MTGWVLRKFSAAWTRLGQRRDLLLEFIALHHQLAVLQRTSTRRPCFRPSERLFWVLLSRWWAAIVQWVGRLERWAAEGLAWNHYEGRANQAALQLAPTTWAPSIVPTVAHVRPSPLPSRVTADDQAAHQAFVATLGGEAVWSDYGVARLVNRVEVELCPFFVD